MVIIPENDITLRKLAKGANSKIIIRSHSQEH